MQKIDPESIMDQTVLAVGGCCVRDLIGHNPSFDNADYLFQRDSIIAELKSLEKDFLGDPTVHEKMHVLYNRWVDDGKNVPLIYGEGILRTDEIPVECARELLSIFKDRLESGVLRKANRQIRETKEKLNYPDALGLLLLSNEGNFAFDPPMMAHILYHALGAKFSSPHEILEFQVARIMVQMRDLSFPDFVAIFQI
jgi:hypothetical protein